MTFDDLANCDSFTFDVTQEDIRAGRPRHCMECPIALAIARTLDLKGAPVYVSGAWLRPIQIQNPDFSPKAITRLCFARTTEVMEFVRDFDNLLPVKPTTFTLKRVNDDL